MARMIEAQIFYRNRESDTTHQINRPIDPPGESVPVVKLMVAEVINQIRCNKSAEYYYVVIKVMKTDGGFAYRTIVPKTML